ncbi:exopolysaccharide biosynthesis protein [Oceaniglobus roseus]|uniref:exopolysaccharide biosynthesis protein n=1 Tax=Oceaniglobus roseus TaxID=1737570 RepID=UPI0013000137|nr:exopolysaccharide biosynthesis protein [Kandeliimicrobium roseum]
MAPARAATTTAAPTEPPRHAVGEVVERLESLTGREEVSLGEIVASFGRSSFLAMLLVPALLVFSPLSGIPLFSTVCGISIALVALQILFRREHLWLPGFLMRLSLGGRTLRRATDALKRLADWLDRHSKPRLQALVSPPLSVAALALCALAGGMTPLLELVPLSASLIGAMVTLIAVGLLVGDGIFVLFGMLFGLCAGLIPVFVVGAVAG